jgi:EAL domain-containing protein (putative c-di-GMP-specific phosphodiesterase class I)
VSGAAATTSTVKKARGRILVVDDEPGLLRSYRRQLDAADFDVEIAENGDDAIAIFGRGAIDAVLTDISMPGMSGVQLLQEIRRRDTDVPVVLATGGPTIESAIAALDHGALKYLVKPVDPKELLEVMGRAVHLNRMAEVKRQALALLGETDARVNDRAGLEAAFDRAIGGIFLVYQPIVDWRAKAIHGFECLVRNVEPAFPHPGALFDAAEKLGRVADLGAKIRDLSPVPMVGRPERLFLNLHPTDLADERLFDPEHALAKMADRIVLEITERSSLDRIPDARGRIARLRALGYRIAVDDLGAGYAGLTSFALLEPDVAKLDMAIVRDVHKLPTKQKLIRSMVDLCGDMGIALVAEGVESRDELDVLADLGCDLFQGYYLAKPARPFPEVRFD